METTETGTPTPTTATAPAATPPADAAPPTSQPDAAPKGGKPRGINPQGVLFSLTKEADASQVKVLDLVFGTRRVGENGDQLVSILDTGSGKIDVYPVVSRFAPKPGHQIRCYVILKSDKVEKRGRHVDRTLGFAIPVNLREAARNNEWLDMRNNVLKVQFRAGRDGFYGFGPNGKVVVVPEGAGFEPTTDKETTVMVSETLKCYLAHCEVAEEMLRGPNKEKGIAVLADTVGANLEGVDYYGFWHDGQLFDACEILGLPTTASIKAIETVHRKLAATEHPDKKAAEFRRISRMEPTEEDLQGFSYEYELIEAARKLMLLQRRREEMRQLYLKAGATVKPDMPEMILVSALAKKLGKSVEVIKKALAHVGYDGTAKTTTVRQITALTAVGYLNSGAFDDLSAPAETQPATGGPDVEDFQKKFTAKVANGK